MISNRQLFQRFLAQTSESPLQIEIEKAEGIYLYDTEGKRYVDLISGIGVSNIGHRNPKVIEAIHIQTSKYLHLMVYGEYVQAPQVLLAKALADTLPGRLDSVYLVNSGAEAVEGALKLAKRYTGRTELIACHKSYHGSTHGALSVSGNEFFKTAYRPLLPDIRFVNFGNENDLELVTAKTAAILLETIQGEAGIVTVGKEYFQKLRKKCDETGTLMILDEIQCGFGRTGTFWAFEQYGICPDILLSAKGMGGGMPIGAFIAPKLIMQTLSFDPLLGHITTFGGHPVSAAAALATLQFIFESGILSEISSKEEMVKKMLQHPKILEVRSKGLMIAVEFGSYAILKPIIDRLIAKGILTDWFLNCDSAMRIAPPLTITNEELQNACSIILEVLNE